MSRYVLSMLFGMYCCICINIPNNNMWMTRKIGYDRLLVCIVNIPLPIVYHNLFFLSTCICKYNLHHLDVKIHTSSLVNMYLQIQQYIPNYNICKYNDTNTRYVDIHTSTYLTCLNTRCEETYTLCLRIEKTCCCINGYWCCNLLTITEKLVPCNIPDLVICGDN